MGTFPRKVVIHANYGLGFMDLLSDCTYDGINTTIQCAYDVLEHPLVINYVITGPEAGHEEFRKQIIAAGFPDSVVEEMCGGRSLDPHFWWEEASVITVEGPYRIKDYDGFESIEHQSGVKWRH